MIRTHNRVLWLVLAAGLLVRPRAAEPNDASPWFRPPDAALFQEGRFVYERNCLVCHGKWGDGKGEMAQGMVPRPRKLSAGVFKYRTTPSGALPTDGDLERTIRGGIYGSSMPMFAQLDDREIRAVIAYVKSFSSKWEKPRNFSAPLPIPAAPAWLSNETVADQHAAKGRALFVQACAACHGAEGKGDGPAAAGLEDDWGQPSIPADLGLPSLHSGPAPRDIYKVLVTGLNGTPMPSFLEATSEADRWDLVAYVLKLRNNAKPPDDTSK